MFYAFMFPRSLLSLGFKRDSTVFVNPSFFWYLSLSSNFQALCTSSKNKKYLFLDTLGFLRKES